MGRDNYWTVLAFVLVFVPFVVFISFSPDSGMPTGKFSVNVNGPEISVNVSVTNESAVLSWMTDISANSTLNVSGDLDLFDFDTEFTKVMDGLDPNTTHSYSILACDNNSDCSTYEDSFTTEANPEEIGNETNETNTTTDTTVPVIDIDVDLGVYSVNVTWSTDESANATFEFNGSEEYFGFDTSFTKEIESLDPDTTYYFNISFCDNVGNCDSEDHQFTTDTEEVEEEEELAIVSVETNTTENTAMLRWQLNKNVTARLHYANVLVIYPLANDFSANLHNLQSNTIYIYNFSACTPDDECVSMLSNFTTELPSDIYEPELVYNISTTQNSSTLTWSTNEEATSMVSFQGSTHITDYDTSFSYVFSDLDAGTTYAGTITVCDRSNNCNVQAFSFTTRTESEVGGPDVVFTVDPSDTHALISWSSTELITSIFSLGEGGTSYGANTQFEKYLADLESSTTYHFTITACDLEINCNTQTGSFTTLDTTPEIPEAPRVIAIATQEEDSSGSDESGGGDVGAELPVSEQPKKIELFGDVHQRVIQEQPTLKDMGASTVVGVIGAFIKNKILASLLLAFLISVLIINITSVFAKREVSICRSSKHTNYLINRINIMIQDKKLHQAYELYPLIIKHYNKIKIEKNKGRFRERVRLLYKQLSLFLVMQRVHHTLDHYSNVSGEELKRLHQYLDHVVKEAKSLKGQIPYKQYKALRQHVGEEHSKCLEQLYEARKKLRSKSK